MIKNYHQNQILIAVNVKIEMQSRLLNFMTLQIKNFYPSNIGSRKKYPPEPPPPPDSKANPIRNLTLTLPLTPQGGLFLAP